MKQAKTSAKSPGRPRHHKDVCLVLMTVRIHPKTLAAIDQDAKASGLSRGKVLDKVFE